MNDNRIMKKTAIIVPVIVVVLLVAALTLNVAFGWLTQSLSNDAYNEKMRIDDDFFELAVTAPDMPDAESESDVIDFLDANGGYVRAGMTSMNTPSIIGRMNDEAMKSSEDVKISPGSFGSIVFYLVLPEGEYEDNVFDFDISISGGSTESPITPTTDSVNELLNGHILLFTGRTVSAHIDATHDAYHYSGLISDGSFTYDTGDHQGSKTTEGGKDYYMIEIYWVWPATFTQMVFSESNPLARGRTVFESENDYVGSSATLSDHGRLIEFISGNPSRYFRYNGNETPPDFAALMVNYRDNYVKLSDGYNSADQSIGDNVRWIITEIKANYNGH